MEPFTKVDPVFREFSLLVNVETVLGFKPGDLVVFRQCAAKDAQRENEIVAVSRPGSRQLEIGQVFFTPQRDIPKGMKHRKRYIRLWNNEYGEFHHDFDIHGAILRPSKESWVIRFSEELSGAGGCCPHNHCKPCTQIQPCSFSCPSLVPLAPQALEMKRRMEAEAGISECGRNTRASCKRLVELERKEAEESREYAAYLAGLCWCAECVEKRRQEHWD